MPSSSSSHSQARPASSRKISTDVPAPGSQRTAHVQAQDSQLHMQPHHHHHSASTSIPHAHVQPVHPVTQPHPHSAAPLHPIPRPESPTPSPLSSFAGAPNSPNTSTSKLPRFLQSPTQRDRSKSMIADRPLSTISTASNMTNASSTSNSSGGRRFLGLGKDKGLKERERQKIREAERRDPTAAELLAVQDADSSFTAYDPGLSTASSPPSAYSSGTARPRPRTRSERPAFSSSTPPSSTSPTSSSPALSSSGHSSHGHDVVPRSPRLGVSLGAGEGGLATRLSGWFSHLSGSTSDLSLTSTITGSLAHSVHTASALASSRSSRKSDSGQSSSHTSSRTARAHHGTPGKERGDSKDSGHSQTTKSGAGKLGNGGGILDKAVRYILDGDTIQGSVEIEEGEEVWFMGVRIAGDGNNSASEAFHAAFYSTVWCTYRAGFEPIRDLSGLSALPPPLVFAPGSPGGHQHNVLATPGGGSHHSHVSRSPSASTGSEGGWSDVSSFSHSSHASSQQSHHSNSSHASNSSYSSSGSGTSSKKRWWGLSNIPGIGSLGTKGWTSDTGWGCMLRTSQSLLATALGRVGEPSLTPSLPPAFPPPGYALYPSPSDSESPLTPPPPLYSSDPLTHAALAHHARLVSWFLDSPASPFGVHRMALAGKAAGKDVGMWFGPNAAGSALRMLVEAFPACGLGVCVGADGSLYQTDVFAASWTPGEETGPRSSTSSSSHGKSSGKAPVKPETRSWGDRPVLILLGIRLGLEGVNPIYYETIKRLYTFPQSVGIAGGRPSSSYYFVGVQGDGLFYLDPHHSRPAVPLRPFMGEDDRGGSMSPELVQQPGRGGSLGPEPQHGAGRGHTPMTEDELFIGKQPQRSKTAPAGGFLAPEEEAHFLRSYTFAELQTFHCERVRKMPLNGLDPSMLLGFVVRDEAEWLDLRKRVKALPRTIFTILDEPVSWPGDDDDDIGMESISDPDEEVPDESDVSVASHAFAQTHVHSHSHSTTHSQSTTGTDDDPVAPLTPLPGARFDSKGYAEEDDGDDEFVDATAEIEDDWVDPIPASEPVVPILKKTPSGKGSKGKSKGKKERAPVPVPSVHYPFPVSGEESNRSTSPPPPRDRNVTVSPRPGGGVVEAGRMHNARARDGGRTQSGGVRGILSEDS